MSDELIFARLATHDAGGANPDPAFQDRLHAALGRELTQRPRPATSLLLVALLGILLLGAAAVAGGLVRIPSPDAQLLNPAVLQPCDVLPGPGVPADGAPRTHGGDPRLGGMACAYDWDGGNNRHFQLRTQFTSERQADGLALRLMPISREIIIEDGSTRAWIGSIEAMGFHYVAVIGYQDPYLFVGYLRAGDKPADAPLPPGPIGDRDRGHAVELVRGVIGNLEALNAGESPGFVLEELTP